MRGVHTARQWTPQVKGGVQRGLQRGLQRALQVAVLVALAGLMSGCPGLIDWPPPLEPSPMAPDVVDTSGAPDVPPVGTPDAIPTDSGPATSNVKPPISGTYPQMKGALMVANLTGELRMVRMRQLRPTVQVDCEAIATAPTQALRPAHFAPATTWQLPSGRAVAVTRRAQGACSAVLIEGTGLPRRLLFWQHTLLPTTVMPSVAQQVPAARAVRILAVEGQATWGEHAVRFGDLKRFDPVAPKGCALPAGEQDLSWSALPGGSQTLVDVVTAPDGCSALDLLTDLGMKRVYLCVPLGMLPFTAGEDLYIAALSTGHNVLPLTGVELLSDKGHLRLGRGGDLVYFGKGAAKVAVTPSCPALHDGVGTYARALSVTIEEPGKPAFQLDNGATLSLQSGGKLHLVRAMDRLVWDTAVVPKLSGTRHIESVWSQP